MAESWTLKLDRADHHLKELDGHIRRFSNGHPYEAVDTGSRKGKVRRYKLRFTDQPDPMFPVIVGDVIHNVRSALDHLVVANVPNNRRSKAGFPIFTTRPFDDQGDLLDNEVGEAWAKLTKGLIPIHRAIIEHLQPYQPADQEVIDFCNQHGLHPKELAGLALLSKFDNADKHRRLLTVAQGLDEGAVVRVRHGVQVETFTTSTFCEDGAELLAVNFSERPDDSKVDVEVRGTVRVALQVSNKGVSRLPGTLERLIQYGRDIAKAFEDAAAAHRAASSS